MEDFLTSLNDLERKAYEVALDIFKDDVRLSNAFKLWSARTATVSTTVSTTVPPAAPATPASTTS